MSAAGASRPADLPDRVRTIFFGSGAFAVPVLDALASMPELELIAVVSAPDRPVGRHGVLTPTPLAARARELGLRLVQPVRVRRPESVAEIAALRPDIAVLADYGQLIPTALLDLPSRGFLNLHPSALPRHRGAAPIPATILAGDERAAVTLMVVSEEMDAGPIVAVEPVDVRPDDTGPELERRAAAAAASLVRRSLPDWLAGALPARPQPSEGVTLTRPLRRDDGRLDPGRRAEELERQVRAYQPWPGAFLETPAGRLAVWRARVCPPAAGDGLDDEPGRLVATAGRLLLTTAGGRLELQEVQLPGGRRMAAADAVRGHPALANTRVVA